jgi:hypothetical protein
MDDIVIRRVVDSDIEVVEEIAVKAFSVHYDFYREKMGERRKVH